MIKTYRNVLNVKKYPKYKDSGIQWIGEIPEHWEVVRNKNIFSLYYSPIKINKEYNLLSLTKKGVSIKDKENFTGKMPSSFDSYQEVLPNQFIFCLFDIDETPRTVGLSRYKGMITSAYTIFDIKEGNSPKYYYYLYLSLDNKKALKPLYTGLRKTIPKDIFLSAKTIRPPLHEQQKIAQFLDKKTQLIDEYIKKKQKKIELLKELKKTIINDAVIGKINVQTGKPYQKYKETGLKWLPQIPEHWEVVKLKYFLIKNESGIWGDIEENGYYVLRSTEQTIDGKWDIKSPARIKISKEVFNKYKLRKGDLVITTSSGSKEHIGKTTIVDEYIEKLNCVFSNFMQRLRTNSLLSPKFLYLLLNNQTIGKFQFKLLSTTSTGLNNINSEVINNIIIPLPPLEEQQKIAQFLDKKTQQIDQLIQKTEKEIKLIKEFKEKLISDAVLGRIKVF